jgi:hypothetical protein
MTGNSHFTCYGKSLALTRGMLDAGNIRARLDYEAEALAVRFLGHRRRFLRRGGALEFREGLWARRWLAEEGV